MKKYHLYIICSMLFLVACKKDIVVIEQANPNLSLDNGIMNYLNKPFTGNLVSYFSGRRLKSDIQYLNGKKEGYEMHWYDDGDLSIERYYKNGQKAGVHKGWWENGYLKFEYHLNDMGEYHGSVKEWYGSGLLARDFNYVNGKENGKQQLRKLDGSIKANYEVVNGERFGLIGLKKCYGLTIGKNEIN